MNRRWALIAVVALAACNPSASDSPSPSEPASSAEPAASEAASPSQDIASGTITISVTWEASGAVSVGAIAGKTGSSFESCAKQAVVTAKLNARPAPLAVQVKAIVRPGS